MTTIRREDFVKEFTVEGKEVDLNLKDPETLDKLQKAGVKKEDLAKVDVNKDGKIKGNAEYLKLFDLVDSFEQGPRNDSFNTTDSRNNPTASGKAYEALKSEVDRRLDQTRAQSVLRTSPTIASSDPYAKHVTQVRSALQNPSAKGVTVFVIGEGETDHSRAITRTIAGKYGLAQGADVRLMKDGGHLAKYVNNHRYTQEISTNRGSLTHTDLAKLAIAQSEGALVAAREEISNIRKNLPNDNKTRIGSISWANNSPIGLAFERIGKLGPNDPILRRAQLEWARAQNPPTRYNPNDSTHDLLSRAFLADKIVAEIKTLQSDPTNQTNFKQLKDGLEKEIADARKQGLLIFNAAGNDGEAASIMGDPKQGTIVFDSIKGMITVGATDLSSPRKMWNSSATGQSIEIAAPGVDIPTGELNNKSAKVTGTSFAAPYAASVAALMVAANQKLTPDDIEKILTSGAVTTDISNTTTDGKGALDPVKAVKEAKKFKPAAVTK